MRGRGVTPRSKPHLFYLAFELLGLNRVATGCRVSDLSSKRSIEKTRGFQFEGLMRESGLNDAGEFEDELLYAILRRDWLQLYDKQHVTVVE
ncbi:GNAT family N-acetyltransferase [Hymenobacter fodinae]|uniref:GNAT family N-acetyltransferase n=1 Tax=Hymenobacter fodinae TaxID=2510796 RepID=UPI001FD8C50B|nr:GNAT family protein [Hymenobacter fodinae]